MNLIYNQRDLVDLLRQTLRTNGLELVATKVKVDTVFLEGPNGGSTILFQGIEVEVRRVS